ncbi:MAG: tRNA (adenosine(37)-N6)-threonylcarbamoyltransferase complex ATPase subunit type 1 TsaE [Mollicutes bacterium]|nr:tRNA (adenosine(37)-N6)-threonylcarbamoyltransferase complex ATPase subunit type 1 TsaE [Mollicutes bacterium]
MEQIMIKIKDEESMIKLGELLVDYAYPNLVIALVGDLGAGKTTLTKGIGKALGVKRVINSPTFTIMKVYETTNEKIKKLYHLDVYRITNSKDDFELEEYFYLDGLAVIEWAHIIQDMLPKNAWEIEIIDLGDDTRQVTIKASSELINKLGDGQYEIIHR